MKVCKPNESKPSLANSHYDQAVRVRFITFLSQLLDHFAALNARKRLPSLSDDAIETLRRSLIFVVAGARRLDYKLLAHAAVTLEDRLRHTATDQTGADQQFDTTRAFQTFMTEARRALAREEEIGLNSRPEHDQTQTVLVIDDDPWTHKFVDRALGDLCMVISAYNGKAAMETLKTMRPEMIVLDVKMPDILGTDLLKVMKSDAGLKHIPIIMLSNAYDNNTVVSGLVGGAIDFISKEVPLGIMRKRMVEVLTNGQMRMN